MSKLKLPPGPSTPRGELVAICSKDVCVALDVLTQGDGRTTNCCTFSASISADCCCCNRIGRGYFPHVPKVLDPRERKRLPWFKRRGLERVWFRLFASGLASEMGISISQQSKQLDKLVAKCKSAASWCGKSWKVPGPYRHGASDWSVVGGA
jgi:hypothetical protein